MTNILKVSGADSPQANLSEFEREPVPQSSLKGPNKFWGMYAGEHCAGTEFMIGPLFLLNGVTLQNIFTGLFPGEPASPHGIYPCPAGSHAGCSTWP